MLRDFDTDWKSKWIKKRAKLSSSRYFLPASKDTPPLLRLRLFQEETNGAEIVREHSEPDSWWFLDDQEKLKKILVSHTSPCWSPGKGDLFLVLWGTLSVWSGDSKSRQSTSVESTTCLCLSCIPYIGI